MDCHLTIQIPGVICITLDIYPVVHLGNKLAHPSHRHPPFFMKKTPWIAALTLAALATLTGIAQAQTLTDIGPAAPTPGPNDISQLLTNGNTAATIPSSKPDGLNYYTDNPLP